MQSRSAPVKPDMLGNVGEEHFRRRFEADYGVDLSYFHYKKAKGTTPDGLPFIVEAAFGKKRDDTEEPTSPSASTGRPSSDANIGRLENMLGRQRVDSFDQVVLAVHIVCPWIEFTDKGKRSVILARRNRERAWSCVESVTAPWKKIKKRSDQGRPRPRARPGATPQAEQANQHQGRRVPGHVESVHEREWQRRISSARKANHVRGATTVLELTGGKCWANSAYFTQELLQEFLEENPELTASWDVVFDASGHLTEPHTDRQIGLGTLEVRDYMKGWTGFIGDGVGLPSFPHDIHTSGPRNRFRFALFIEKEGFDPLLERAQIAERFDIAIMSTKGMSVTAARQLVDELSFRGVTVLVVHDFDKSGFSILQTLQSNSRRYTFKNKPKVIDLGLRLSDVNEMSLQSEPVSYASKSTRARTSVTTEPR